MGQSTKNLAPKQHSGERESRLLAESAGGEEKGSVLENVLSECPPPCAFSQQPPLPFPEKLRAVTHVPTFQTARKMMSPLLVIAGPVSQKKQLYSNNIISVLQFRGYDPTPIFYLTYLSNLFFQSSIFSSSFSLYSVSLN